MAVIIRHLRQFRHLAVVVWPFFSARPFSIPFYNHFISRTYCRKTFIDWSNLLQKCQSECTFKTVVMQDASQHDRLYSIRQSLYRLNKARAATSFPPSIIGCPQTNMRSQKADMWFKRRRLPCRRIVNRRGSMCTAYSSNWVVTSHHYCWASLLSNGQQQ